MLYAGVDIWTRGLLVYVGVVFLGACWCCLGAFSVVGWFWSTYAGVFWCWCLDMKGYLCILALEFRHGVIAVFWCCI